MKKIMNFKIENIGVILYIILVIRGINILGFNDNESFIFNLILIVAIPFIYYGIRITRRTLKSIWW